MLNLVLNISGGVAIVCNVFLLTVICFFGKGKEQNTATELGFRFLQMTMVLNILATGGLLWQKI